MDISSNFQDILNDESFINVVKELDEFEIFTSKVEAEKVTTPSAKKAKTARKHRSKSGGAISLGDLTTSQVHETCRFQDNLVSNWYDLEKSLNAHVASILNPVKSFVLEAPIPLDDSTIPITRRKREHLSELVAELVLKYKELWEETYSVKINGGSALQKENWFEEDVSKRFNGLSGNFGLAVISGAQGTPNTDEKIPKACNPNTRQGIEQLKEKDWSVKERVVEYLSKRSTDTFYHLIEGLLEKDTFDLDAPHLCRSMDLLCAMLEAMPALSVLFMIPAPRCIGKNKLVYTAGSSASAAETTSTNKENKCGYYKLFVMYIRRIIKNNYLTTPERSLSLTQVYTNALEGKYLPFHLMCPQQQRQGESEQTQEWHHDYMETRFNNCTCIVYLLHRLIRLTSLITHWLMDLFYDSQVQPAIQKRLLKRFKKYIVLPFLNIRQIHELLLMYGYLNLKDFPYTYQGDLSSLMANYLYPPPPLAILRIELLELLLKLVAVSGVYIGKKWANINAYSLRNSKKVKKRNKSREQQKPQEEQPSTVPAQAVQEDVEKLKEQTDTKEPRETGVVKRLRVNVLLRRRVFLLLFSCSFMVSADFMKKSVDNIAEFFGIYYATLPLYDLTVCFKDVSAIVQDRVYIMQWKCLEFIQASMGTEMMSEGNVLNTKSRNLMLDNVLKRLLILSWHYSTGNKLDGSYDNIPVETAYSKGTDGCASDPLQRCISPNCLGRCSTITPYNIVDMIAMDAHRCNIVLSCRELDTKTTYRQYIVSDELEELVKKPTTTLDSSSKSMSKQHGKVEYAITSECPWQAVTENLSSVSSSASSASSAASSAYSITGRCGGPECVLKVYILEAPKCREMVNYKRNFVTKSALYILASYGNEHGLSSALGDLEPIWHTLKTL